VPRRDGPAGRLYKSARLREIPILVADSPPQVDPSNQRLIATDRTECAERKGGPCEPPKEVKATTLLEVELQCKFQIARWADYTRNLTEGG